MSSHKTIWWARSCLAVSIHKAKIRCTVISKFRVARHFNRTEQQLIMAAQERPMRTMSHRIGTIWQLQKMTNSNSRLQALTCNSKRRKTTEWLCNLHQMMNSIKQLNHQSLNCNSRNSVKILSLKSIMQIWMSNELWPEEKGVIITSNIFLNLRETIIAMLLPVPLLTTHKIAV